MPTSFYFARYTLPLPLHKVPVTAPPARKMSNNPALISSSNERFPTACVTNDRVNTGGPQKVSSSSHLVGLSIVNLPFLHHPENDDIHLPFQDLETESDCELSVG